MTDETQDITIDGKPWKTFSMDTPDEQVLAEYRQEIQRRAGAAISAGQRRDTARSTSPFTATGIRGVSPGLEGYSGTGEEVELPYSVLNKVAPTAGALIGGTLGAGAGGAGAVPGAAMGAAAGEGINRLASRLITPQAERPTVAKDLLAMGKEGAATYLIPKAALGAAKVGGKWLGKLLPGAKFS